MSGRSIIRAQVLTVGLVAVQAVAQNRASVNIVVPDFTLDTRIVWSDPPDHFVDTSQPYDLNGRPAGIDTIYVEFDREVRLSYANIDVAANSREPITVADVWYDNGTWVVVLDRVLLPGESASMAFGGGVTYIAFESRPGDINHDGRTDRKDLANLSQVVESGAVDVVAYDFNRDGLVDNGDVQDLQETLERPGRRQTPVVWIDTDTEPLRGWICCCTDGVCGVQWSESCVGGSPRVCPCTGGSCID